MAKEMPEVRYAVSTISFGADNSTLSIPSTDKNIKSKGLYAGADFFHVFSYGLTQGNPGQVLTDKNSIVLSDLLARRLFGTTENLIGKTVTFPARTTLYHHGGIFTSPGIHSSEQFDFVLSILGQKDAQENLTNWDNTFCDTGISSLKPGANKSPHSMPKSRG